MRNMMGRIAKALQQTDQTLITEPELCCAMMKIPIRLETKTELEGVWILDAYSWIDQEMISSKFALFGFGCSAGIGADSGCRSRSLSASIITPFIFFLFFFLPAGLLGFPPFFDEFCDALTPELIIFFV